jgi:hypothetical protein
VGPSESMKAAGCVKASDSAGGFDCVEICVCIEVVGCVGFPGLTSAACSLEYPVFMGAGGGVTSSASKSIIST